MLKKFADENNISFDIKNLFVDEDEQSERYPIFQLYKKQQDKNWSKEDIKFDKDIEEWQNNKNDKLTPQIKNIIKNIVAFFLISEKLVIDNVAKLSDYPEEKNIECVFFSAIQSAVECVHSDVYTTMAKVISKDTTDFLSLLENEISLIEKIKFIMESRKPSNTYGEALVYNGAVEGILFSSAFIFINGLKKIGVLEGFADANGYISTDEALHADAAAVKYRILVKDKLSEEKFYNIIRRAVEVEEKFINFIIEDNKLLDITREKMICYIKFITDKLCVDFGYKPMYDIKQRPFEWNTTSLKEINNFFERYNTQYSNLSVNNKLELNPSLKY